MTQDEPEEVLNNETEPEEAEEDIETLKQSLAEEKEKAGEESKADEEKADEKKEE